MSDQFNTLNLNDNLLKNLEELEFHSMTPIQQQGLPIVLAGKDVIAQAKTGSGKTAVFGLGILNSLDMSSLKVQSLILCPTRELAEQVAKEIRMLARMMKNIKVLTLCGGVQEIHQEKSILHGAHIIVGTPGRTFSFLKSQLLNLDEVKMFVLDEADRMLDMGFHEDIMHIESFVPKNRQTMLFSATFPDKIDELSKDVLTNPESIKVDTEHAEDIIEEIFYKVSTHQDKNDALLKVLNFYRPERLIVFCKTKQIVDSVTKLLNKNNIHAAGIHGDIKQNDRTAVLTMFSNQSLSVLVATDVAARGLDIKELPAVINLDLTNDPEVYVHRIGRTGRAGHTGLALSFFVEENDYKLVEIEELTGKDCHVESINTIMESSPYSLIPPMETVFISGGKKNKLRPGDIVGAFVNELKLSADMVGDINIGSVNSYVAIKRNELPDDINHIMIKKKKFRIGFA